MDMRCPLRLEPSGLPGRSNRKARDFQLEIQRLRDQGYTLDAIREALADAGVHVSKSTVRREAVRRRPVRLAALGLASLQSHQAQAASRPGVPGSHLANDARSGRDIAREFFDGRITNPLILARGQR